MTSEIPPDSDINHSIMHDVPLGNPPPNLNRTQAFKHLLNNDVIDIQALRHLASKGIPEEDRGLRSTVWKLLLGFYPSERAQWQHTLIKKHNEYDQFCKELIIDPSTLGTPPHDYLVRTTTSNNNNNTNTTITTTTTDAILQRQTVSHDDHPLSTSDSSRWRTFFADTEIRDQIQRDVDRTHPDLNFFSSQTEESIRHRSSMSRALFIYAKLNPGLQYVQGMNELYAPLYYTFATDVDTHSSQYAESIAFFCFIDLLSEFRDHFCQQLDNSEVGIKATMSRLSSLLRLFDPLLYRHVEISKKINPQFYAFRWITTLLTQEFPFPDALRLWDVLLSDTQGRSDCLLRICVAMVLLVRDELLQGDFASNMKLLQNYPPVDVAIVLQQAEDLKQYKTVIVLDE